ncbi:MAG: hypothetical protein A3I00_02555 [Betaproteobacteria bacterium RIFCSPLOWO2_02_FULL_64_12]|nr:MAG: hypothetical protein A3I00_02555 [Betaproteobacteria bacterium RIFCSPLOWO2_02_FULL_64_12]
MLPEEGRRAVVDQRGLRKPHRTGHLRHLAGERIIDLDLHPAVLHLRVRENFGHRVDRSARHPHAVERADKIVPVPLREFPRNQPQQLVPVPDAVDVERVARIGCELGSIERLDKLGELRVVAASEHDIAVAAFENLLRHDVGVAVAPAARSVAGQQVVHRLVGERRDLDVEHGDVDVLAVPGDLAARERRQHRDCGVHPGHEIEDRNPDFHGTAAGPAVLLPGDAHQSAHRLDEEIVGHLWRLGTGLAETGDRAIDQAGIDFRQIGITELVSRQRAGLEVLQQYIRALRERPHDALAFGLLQNDGDRAFAPIGCQVIAGLARLRSVPRLEVRRSPGPGIVASTRALDLDGVGTEIGEQLPGPRSGHHAAEIENSNMGKRPRPFGAPRAGAVRAAVGSRALRHRHAS